MDNITHATHTVQSEVANQAMLAARQTPGNGGEITRSLVDQSAPGQAAKTPSAANEREFRHDEITRLADSNIIIVNGEKYIPLAIHEEVVAERDQTTAYAYQLQDCLTQRDNLLIITNQLYEAERAKGERGQQMRANKSFEPGTHEVMQTLDELMSPHIGEEKHIPLPVIEAKCGLKSQAISRHAHLLANSDLIGLRAETVEIKVPGQAKKEKRTDLYFTRLAEFETSPKEWVRADGKQVGGARKKCKKCGCENVLRDIHHTYCPECNTHDIRIPEDLQMIMDEYRLGLRQVDEEYATIQTEDAPAAVAEAEMIVTQAAQSTEIPTQDTREAAQVEQTDTLPIRSEQATESALEGEETPEEHQAAMDRINANNWAKIEAEDPGCWVPASVITYWRKQGREYVITHDELPPVSQPQARPTRNTHKVVNLSSGQIEEVSE